VQLTPLFHTRHQNQMYGIIALILTMAVIGSLIYFRAPIAGSISNLVPLSLEKKMADQIFTKRDGDKNKSEKLAEEKLIQLVKEINEYNPAKYTIHLSSSQEINAYATIGGHIFINKGLIKSMKAPEDLLGVVGHEMIHAKERHVIKSLFQSLGLFALFQFLVGDITGIAAVLVDGGGPLLQLSYSRDLETEADVKSVELMLVSRINPNGLARALTSIESENKKIIAETPGGEKIDELMNQTFLRSHPQSVDRNKMIQVEINRLEKTEKYKNLKFKDLIQPWDELQAALSNL
jgi:Zn-dependent protease with chaperone function